MNALAPSPASPPKHTRWLVYVRPRAPVPNVVATEDSLVMIDTPVFAAAVTEREVRDRYRSYEGYGGYGATYDLVVRPQDTV